MGVIWVSGFWGILKRTKRALKGCKVHIIPGIGPLLLGVIWSSRSGFERIAGFEA